MVAQNKIKYYSFLLLLLFSCKSHVEYYLLPSTENISAHVSSISNKEIELNMAQGESEHVQLVFKGNPGETYEIIRESTAPLKYMCREIKRIEKYDDALVDCNGKITLTDSIAKLWITYTTDRGTPKGCYTEKIKISGKEKEQLISIPVNVYNVSLPVTPTIPAIFGIIEKNLIDSLSPQKTLEKKKEWAEVCLTYRMNPYFSTWIRNSMCHEASSSPFAWNTPETYSFLNDERYKAVALPYHSLSEEELREMLTGMRKNGLLAKSYFYLWDEPALMSEYALIKGYANKIHTLELEAKILTSFYCGPKDGRDKDNLYSVFDLWRGDTQIFAMSAWALQKRESVADSCRAALKKNEEWWTYVCMGPDGKEPNLHLGMTGYQHRGVMWRSWKEKTTGFLYWAVNAYAENDSSIFRKDLPAGDGILLYPGDSFGLTEPVVSVRMERWRDGMEDYEYMVMLEKKVGRAKAESLFASIYRNCEDFVHDSVHLEKFRKSVLDILKK